MAPALVDEASSIVPIPLGRSGPRPPAIDTQGNPRTEPGGFAEADHVFVGVLVAELAERHRHQTPGLGLEPEGVHLRVQGQDVVTDVERGSEQASLCEGQQLCGEERRNHRR